MRSAAVQDVGRAGIGPRHARDRRYRQPRRARFRSGRSAWIEYRVWYRSMRDPQPKPATLGTSLAAGVRITITCRGCGHQAEPDLANHAFRFGESLELPTWAAHLVCSICGAGNPELIVS